MSKGNAFIGELQSLSDLQKDSILKMMHGGGFRGELFPHQIQAVHRIVNRAIRGYADGHRVQSTLCCDECGLGKTITALAVACCLKSAIRCNTQSPFYTASADRPILILAPLSLVEQWREQICKFTIYSNNSIITYQGSQRSKYNYDLRAGRAEFVIANYDSLRLAFQKGWVPSKSPFTTIIGKKRVIGYSTTYERGEGHPLIDATWGYIVMDEVRKRKKTGFVYLCFTHVVICSTDTCREK